METRKVKFENNWKQKTLENLEKSNWGEPTYDSYLVKTCHKLRRKPLEEFETEDLRIMIGQNIGLDYLIPLALETLKENILAEGHMYEGDLLNSVLTSEKEFWQKNLDFYNEVLTLIEQNKNEIDENQIKTKEFEQIN
jgi:hypothetical protein